VKKRRNWSLTFFWNKKFSTPFLTYILEEEKKISTISNVREKKEKTIFQGRFFIRFFSPHKTGKRCFYSEDAR